MAIVVACSDSRLSPEILFDTGLGDLFVGERGGQRAERRRPRIEHTFRTGASLCIVLGLIIRRRSA